MKCSVEVETEAGNNGRTGRGKKKKKERDQGTRRGGVGIFLFEHGVRQRLNKTIGEEKAALLSGPCGGRNYLQVGREAYQACRWGERKERNVGPQGLAGGRANFSKKKTSGP